MNSLNSSKRRSPRLLKIIFSGYLLLLVPVKALNIAHTSDASTVEQQAAKEVRRYVFLRTGIAPDDISKQICNLQGVMSLLSALTTNLLSQS